MIWVHGYENEQEVLEGVTRQLFKHIESTRFITPCTRTRRRKRSESHIPQVTIDPPKSRFFLALPGDKFGAKMLDFWEKYHHDNPIWKNAAYYQTHERHNIPEHTWKEHPFFSKAGVPISQIHPIEQSGNAEKNASTYTLLLPHSRGLYYNPAHAFEGDYATRMYESPFHCAICFIDRSGEICFATNNYPPFYGTTYYTVDLDNKDKGITLSAEALLDIPRLLLILLENDFEFITGSSTVSFILKNHHNIHLFSNIKNFEPIVKEKGLDSMWFYEIRVSR